MGLLKDVEPLYRRALEAQERTLGAEHPDTLVSMNNLAGCLEVMGMLKDAEPLYKKTLEARSALSVRSILTHWSQSTIWQVALKPWAWLKDAEPLYRRALEASERTLGTEHPHTLLFAKNLARFFKGQLYHFVAASTCSGGHGHQ